MARPRTIEIDGDRLRDSCDPTNKTEAAWLQDQGLLDPTHELYGQPVVFRRADGTLVSNDPTVAARQQLTDNGTLEALIHERATAMAADMVRQYQQGQGAVMGENTGNATNTPVGPSTTSNIWPPPSHAALSGTGMAGDPDNEQAAQPVGVEVDSTIKNLKPGRRLTEGSRVTLAADESGEGEPAEEEVPPYSSWNVDPLRVEAANRGLDTSGPKGALVKRLEADDKAFEAAVKD